MKKRSRIWAVGAVVLVGVILFGSGVKVGAATNEPGSAGDPLITRSYLESRLENLEISGGFECITLTKGKTISFHQGAQVIMYSGTAEVTGNLIDMTIGALATEGTSAEKYHNYLVPADKSGFTADTTCVIFVFGEKY